MTSISITVDDALAAEFQNKSPADRQKLELLLGLRLADLVQPGGKPLSAIMDEISESATARGLVDVKPTRLLGSENVHEQIDNLLLSGQASTAFEAEEMFLDDHLTDLARLGLELDEDSFRAHEAVKLLMSHGSRPFEDSLA